MIDDNNKAIDARATNKALFKNTGIIAIGQMSTKVINFFCFHFILRYYQQKNTVLWTCLVHIVLSL